LGSFFWEIIGNDFARISQAIDFTLRIVGFVIKDVIFLNVKHELHGILIKHKHFINPQNTNY
jgi:hypothetical protein